MNVDKTQECLLCMISKIKRLQQTTSKAWSWAEDNMKKKKNCSRKLRKISIGISRSENFSLKGARVQMALQQNAFTIEALYKLKEMDTLNFPRTSRMYHQRSDQEAGLAIMCCSTLPKMRMTIRSKPQRAQTLELIQYKIEKCIGLKIRQSIEINLRSKKYLAQRQSSQRDRDYQFLEQKTVNQGMPRPKKKKRNSKKRKKYLRFRAQKG